ncbi:UNVERIFIED_CONTAM: hypothetical protein FKN15_071301 [Acipenser sinensis]
MTDYSYIPSYKRCFAVFQSGGDAVPDESATACSDALPEGTLSPTRVLPPALTPCRRGCCPQRERYRLLRRPAGGDAVPNESATACSDALPEGTLSPTRALPPALTPCRRGRGPGPERYRLLRRPAGGDAVPERYRLLRRPTGGDAVPERYRLLRRPAGGDAVPERYCLL